MRRRFVVIENSTAGRGRQEQAGAVLEALRAHGAAIDTCSGADESAALTRARTAIRTNPPDAVIAAGGDGTVRLAAKVVAGTGIALGFIPLGTGNVLAHEVNWPRAPMQLADLLRLGAARPIHTATANGELFLLMAGAGFDGRVIQALDHKLKNRIGKLAYAGPALRALNRPPDQLDVTIDGKQMRATWAIAANACRYGGAYRLAPDTSIAKPGLQVVLFRGATTIARIRELLALARGRLATLARADTGVEIRPGSHIRFQCQEPLPCQLDGDSFGTTPLDITANGPEVRLIWPQGEVENNERV